MYVPCVVRKGAYSHQVEVPRRYQGNGFERPRPRFQTKKCPGSQLLSRGSPRGPRTAPTLTARQVNRQVLWFAHRQNKFTSDALLPEERTSGPLGFLWPLCAALVWVSLPGRGTREAFASGWGASGGANNAQAANDVPWYPNLLIAAVPLACC